MCYIDGYTDEIYIEAEQCGKNRNKQDSAIQRLDLPQSPKTLGRKKKAKASNISLYFYPTNRPRNPPGGHAVFSDDTSLRCYRLSSPLPTFFSGLLAQHIACQIC